MRTTSISPEFKYTEVYGTLSMSEKKSFLSSKMLKTENNIFIKNENIIFYQNLFNEQIDLGNESSLPPKIYNTIIEKGKTLLFKDSQTNEQLNSNTRWVLKIDIKTLLTDYLFATFKKYRTFEGVKNNMVLSNDVDISIKDYININILNRYAFDKVEIFVSYNNLLDNNLRFDNKWDQSIENDINILKRFETKTDLINMEVELAFNQEKPSTEYSFNYYYNLYFSKI